MRLKEQLKEMEEKLEERIVVSPPLRPQTCIGNSCNVVCVLQAKSSEREADLVRRYQEKER